VTAKTWPEDRTQDVPFEDIIEPAIDAVLQAYRLQSRRVAAIDWKGLPIAPSEAACCPNIDLEEGMAFWREYDRDHGRTHSDLRTILGQTIRVAIEQGRRLERRKL
jgi:hypothetical protein